MPGGEERARSPRRGGRQRPSIPLLNRLLGNARCFSRVSHQPFLSFFHFVVQAQVKCSPRHGCLIHSKGIAPKLTFHLGFFQDFIFFHFYIKISEKCNLAVRAGNCPWQQVTRAGQVTSLQYKKCHNTQAFAFRKIFLEREKHVWELG